MSQYQHHKNQQQSLYQYMLKTCSLHSRNRTACGAHTSRAAVGKKLCQDQMTDVQLVLLAAPINTQITPGGIKPMFVKDACFCFVLIASPRRQRGRQRGRYEAGLSESWSKKRLQNRHHQCPASCAIFLGKVHTCTSPKLTLHETQTMPSLLASATGVMLGHLCLSPTRSERQIHASSIHLTLQISLEIKLNSFLNDEYENVSYSIHILWCWLPESSMRSCKYPVLHALGNIEQYSVPLPRCPRTSSVDPWLQTFKELWTSSKRN